MGEYGRECESLCEQRRGMVVTRIVLTRVNYSWSPRECSANVVAIRFYSYLDNLSNLASPVIRSCHFHLLVLVIAHFTVLTQNEVRQMPSIYSVSSNAGNTSST